MKRLLIVFVVIVSSIALNGCFPNTGRTNAKLSDGLDFAVIGGGQYMLDGEGTNVDRTSDNFAPYGELNLQYAWAEDPADWNFALQAKVPLFLIFSTLDFYAQAPTSFPFYTGVGAELGVVSSIYAPFTYYLNEKVYLTYTQRFHFYTGETEDKNDPVGGNGDSLSKFWINPQLALGFDLEYVDLAIFAYYNFVPGSGADFSVCIFGEGDNCEGTDFRKHFFQFGVAARF